MPETRSAAKWWLWILLATVLLGGLGLYAPQAVEESHNADFRRYFTAGRVALRGGDIYEAGGAKRFKYFPFFAQCMMPVAYVGEAFAERTPEGDIDETSALRAGALVWYGILCLAYLGSLALAVGLTGARPGRAWMWPLLLALAFSARIFVGNVRNGQINMPVMFLAVLGCWLLARGRDRWGGVAIALGAAIKFMPIVLLLWCVRQKRWGALGAAGLTLLAVLFVVPAFSWGLNGNLEQLQGYINRRHKMVTDLPENQAAGQSLASMSNRLLRKVNAASLRRENDAGEADPIYIHVIDAPPAVAKWVALLLVLVVTAATVRMLSPTPARASPRCALEAGLIFLLMLMISPETRKAHFVTVLVPLAALAVTYVHLGWTRRQTVVLGLAFFCLALSSSGVLGEGDLYDYANAYGVMFWGGVLLYLAVSRALVHLGDDREACAQNALPGRGENQ